LDNTTNITQDKGSKGQILKSTAVFGSAQLVIIFVGLVRVKVLAVLLGPVGVGISGLYFATIELLKTIFSLGLGYSAVKEISSALARDDNRKTATVLKTLWRCSWVLGVLGMLAAIFFSRQLSYAAFGNADYAKSISILSIALPLSILALSEGAVLQGFRRIRDMAKASIWSSLIGLGGAFIMYSFWGLNGIIPAILFVFCFELLITWFYARKIKAPSTQLSWSQTFKEGRSMVALGFFMTASLLSSTISLYFVRSFIVQQNDLISVGFFIAAWTISSMYMLSIFNAMGADYFPRLSSVAHDPAQMKKAVNEQTEIALLLTAPVIIATISFADILISILYSKEFQPTASILTWQLAGDFFKVLSWPMGFILLAKGKGIAFLVTELIWNLCFCAMVYFGWQTFQIEITGIAFLIAYFIYLVILYCLCMKLISFNWSKKVWKSVALYLPLLVCSFLCAKYMAWPVKYVAGAFITLIALAYSFSQLKNVIKFKSILNKLSFKKVF